MTGLEAALTAAAAKEAFTPARQIIERVGRASYNRLLAAFSRTFAAHVDAVNRRCSNIKNIIYRDQSVSLLSQYVNVNFEKRKSPRGSSESISDGEVLDALINGAKCVLSGTAGAGKTMFMKWAALKCISGINGHGLIPLFIELRYITADNASIPLRDYLLEKTASSKGRVSLDQFEIGLEAGHFAIILDAVDEINPAYRDKVIDNLRDFIQLYPQCPLIISTRPSETVESLQDVSVIRTTPMSQEQIIEVLERVDYDAEVKGKLIARIKYDLYETHSGFLSNPLLVTIMLLSFDHAADVPTRLTSFYKQAFEALYQRHDAAKGTYRRGHHAGLPLDEFERVFSTFCYRTYVISKYEFSDSELLRFFREAAAYTQIGKEPSDLVRDSMESVCLIQKEGLDNVFVHRSFQEYFASIFVSQYRGEDVRQVIESVVGDDFRSNALRMLFDLNKDLVEIEWLIPHLGEWLQRVSGLNLATPSGLASFLRITWRDIDIKLNGDIDAVAIVATGALLSSLGRLYDDQVINDAIFETGVVPGARTVNDLRKDPETMKLPSFKRSQGNIMVSHDEDGGHYVNVNPSDADWLIKTNLPTRLDGTRTAVESLRNMLLQRQMERRSTIKRMRAAEG